ncbi:MAG: Gfo/Idh/MocA family oxidoreductase [Caldilineaceae bacterium]|nr:Gfo/Idh/MocA family oxidoreductase [Caldilineaceae bacterium]
MSNPVRIGVVGAGSISLRGIMPHLSQADVQPLARMTAVCDPVPGRAQAAAEKFNVPHAYESYEELLDSGEVDAITIASPIGIHYEQGKAAIERGIHIHFNKTMTTTRAEADDLIALAEQKGVKLLASPGQMLNGVHRSLRRMVLDGTIGELVWCATGIAIGRGHEGEPIRQGDDVLSNINPSWYFRRPGGGPMYDMTVYSLHTLTGILGPAQRVTAFSGLRFPERSFRGELVTCDMDDNTFMVLDFGSARFAFVYGAAAGNLLPWGSLALFGTKGNITRAESSRDYLLNGEVIDASQAPPLPVGPANCPLHPELPEGHVYADIMELVHWIRTGEESIVTVDHARHVIEIIEAGYRAAETGQAQTLTSTFAPVAV